MYQYMQTYTYMRLYIYIYRHTDTHEQLRLANIIFRLGVAGHTDVQGLEAR